MQCLQCSFRHVKWDWLPMLRGGSNVVDTRHQECTVLCNDLAVFTEERWRSRRTQTCFRQQFDARCLFLFLKWMINSKTECCWYDLFLIWVDNGVFMNIRTVVIDCHHNLFLIMFNCLSLWPLCQWVYFFLVGFHLCQTATSGTECIYLIALLLGNPAGVDREELFCKRRVTSAWRRNMTAVQLCG